MYFVRLRVTLLNRTYGTNKNIYLAIFTNNPIYYGPP